MIRPNVSIGVRRPTCTPSCEIQSDKVLNRCWHRQGSDDRRILLNGRLRATRKDSAQPWSGSFTLRPVLANRCNSWKLAEVAVKFVGLYQTRLGWVKLDKRAV